ncbi:hypothetical protein FA13DRAFT_97216 [Coprinellus micaceus]|uniref:Uncharacterized protein n=1 Tax=Coprinellus micaceus TaxID=71717 RepID=A0A4Y7SIF7_COPMI|nr:hypothetical protein FA13DRAFT_97216 [Coprinellus micaceus]
MTRRTILIVLACSVCVLLKNALYEIIDKFLWLQRQTFTPPDETDSDVEATLETTPQPQEVTFSALSISGEKQPSSSSMQVFENLQQLAARYHLPETLPPPPNLVGEPRGRAQPRRLCYHPYGSYVRCYVRAFGRRGVE